MEVLQSLVKLFGPIVEPPTMDTCIDCDEHDEGSDEADAAIVREVDDDCGDVIPSARHLLVPPPGSLADHVGGGSGRGAHGLIP